MRWILLRHAKASWPPGIEDRDRPLDPSGREDALRMGQWLQANGWMPDRVACSPARRARQTLEAVAAAWDPAPEVHFEDRLYDGRVADVEACLEGEGTVMVVGHNPSMDAFLGRHAPEHGPMVPGAAACFEDGRLQTLVRPEDLPR